MGTDTVLKNWKEYFRTERGVLSNKHSLSLLMSRY